VNCIIAGTVRVVADADGDLSIKAYNGLSGKVEIGGVLRGRLSVSTETHNTNVTGSIEIGRLAGSIFISGDLGDPNNEPTDPNDPNMPGHICIDGAFAPDSPDDNAPSITINGERRGERSFIAVNYSGWMLLDPNDPNVVVWDPNATVTIRHGGVGNPSVYRGDDPNAHVREISKCRGDADNSFAFNFGDVNPFVLGLTDGPGYALAYPGLGGVAPDPNVGGSRLFHCDMNGDGALNFADISAFVYRFNNGACCSPSTDPNICLHEGGQEQGRGNGGDGGPEALAEQLALNVAPELFDSVVELAARCAAGLPDEEQRAYWQTVYEALTE
jgi:hypothetical protein